MNLLNRKKYNVTTTNTKNKKTTTALSQNIVRRSINCLNKKTTKKYHLHCKSSKYSLDKMVLEELKKQEVKPVVKTPISKPPTAKTPSSLLAKTKSAATSQFSSIKANLLSKFTSTNPPVTPVANVKTRANALNSVTRSIKATSTTNVAKPQFNTPVTSGVTRQASMRTPSTVHTFRTNAQTNQLPKRVFNSAVKPANPSTPANNKNVNANLKKNISRTVDCAKTAIRRSIRLLNSPPGLTLTPDNPHRRNLFPSGTKIPVLKAVAQRDLSKTEGNPQRTVNLTKTAEQPKSIKRRSLMARKSRLSAGLNEDGYLLITPKIMRQLIDSASKARSVKKDTINESVQEEDDEMEIKIKSIKPSSLLKMLLKDKHDEKSELEPVIETKTEATSDDTNKMETESVQSQQIVSEKKVAVQTIEIDQAKENISEQVVETKTETTSNESNKMETETVQNEQITIEETTTTSNQMNKAKEIISEPAPVENVLAEEKMETTEAQVALNETKEIESKQTTSDEETPVVVETTTSTEPHQEIECDVVTNESVEMQVAESEINQQVETTSEKKSEMLAENIESTVALQAAEIEISTHEVDEIKTESPSVNETSLKLDEPENEIKHNEEASGDKEITNEEVKAEEKAEEVVQLTQEEDKQSQVEELIQTTEIVEDSKTEEEIPVDNLIQNKELVQEMSEVAEEEAKQEDIKEEEPKETQIEEIATNTAESVTETNVPLEQQQPLDEKFIETEHVQLEENQPVENNQIENEVVETIENDENKLVQQEEKFSQVEESKKTVENTEQTTNEVCIETQSNITLETAEIEKEMLNQAEEPVVNEQPVEADKLEVSNVAEEPVVEAKQVEIVEKPEPIVESEIVEQSEHKNDKVDSNNADNVDCIEEQPVEVKKPKANTKGHRGRPKRKQPLNEMPTAETVAEPTVEKTEIAEIIHNDQVTQAREEANVAENAPTSTEVCIETQSNITLETAEIEKEIENNHKVQVNELPAVEIEKASKNIVAEHVEENPVEEKKPKGHRGRPKRKQPLDEIQNAENTESAAEPEKIEEVKEVKKRKYTRKNQKEQLEEPAVEEKPQKMEVEETEPEAMQVEEEPAAVAAKPKRVYKRKAAAALPEEPAPTVAKTQNENNEPERMLTRAQRARLNQKA